MNIPLSKLFFLETHTIVVLRRFPKILPQLTRTYSPAYPDFRGKLNFISCFKIFLAKWIGQFIKIKKILSHFYLYLARTEPPLSTFPYTSLLYSVGKELH